ncbi:MAG: sialate O-acetylesterase [Chitinophagaceae bacterium]|nr:MAG: sialate O-acetylesterase [Chitinophagaceae bacterium]
MRRSSLILFYFFFLVLAQSASAEIRLPAIISDHMVLQAGSEVTLWGWCDAGEDVRVRTGWDTATYRTKGTSDATFRIRLRTPRAGGPFRITFSGRNEVEVSDVLLGEVWLCSGQSNMEMNVHWGLPYTREADSAMQTDIRFFHVPRTTSEYPQDDVKARWVVCTPETMKAFSAVGYFFGLGIHRQLGQAVGLIGASWSGTPAEVWTPAELVLEDAALAAAAKRPDGLGWPVRPGVTYNAMIHPLRYYALAGAIWYQGESNVGNAATYVPLLTRMIDAWRGAWGRSLSFYLVQIAPFAGYGNEPAASLLREAQARVAAHPGAGMVVTHDLVDDVNDIHPKMKKEVGERLARYALGDHYGLPGIAFRSPSYASLSLEKGRARIAFNNVPGGLMTKGALRGFRIAGSDRRFVPASARIDGSTVLVWSKEIKAPAAVRYGFSNDAMPNLYSREGLPVAVFRTDSWDDVPTVGAKRP